MKICFLQCATRGVSESRGRLFACLDAVYLGTRDVLFFRCQRHREVYFSRRVRE